MRETPSLESAKEEETFSSLAVMEKAVSEENELRDSFCWVYNRRNTFLLGVYNRKNPFCNGWDSFCRVQMEETLYVEYLMEETLSAGVYNRVNTFSVSVMEETLSAG